MSIIKTQYLQTDFLHQIFLYNTFCNSEFLNIMYKILLIFKNNDKNLMLYNFSNNQNHV